MESANNKTGNMHARTAPCSLLTTHLSLPLAPPALVSCSTYLKRANELTRQKLRASVRQVSGVWVRCVVQGHQMQEIWCYRRHMGYSDVPLTPVGGIFP